MLCVRLKNQAATLATQQCLVSLSVESAYLWSSQLHADRRTAVNGWEVTDKNKFNVVDTDGAGSENWKVLCYDMSLHQRLDVGSDEGDRTHVTSCGIFYY